MGWPFISVDDSNSVEQFEKTAISNATEADKENDILFKLNWKVLSQSENNTQKPASLAPPQSSVRPDSQSRTLGLSQRLPGQYVNSSDSKKQFSFPASKDQLDRTTLQEPDHAVLGKRSPVPQVSASPMEGAFCIKSDLLANRPTTRALTKMQKAILYPTLPPPPVTPKRPPPRSAPRGKVSTKSRPAKATPVYQKALTLKAKLQAKRQQTPPKAYSPTPAASRQAKSIKSPKFAVLKSAMARMNISKAALKREAADRMRLGPLNRPPHHTAYHRNTYGRTKSPSRQSQSSSRLSIKEEQRSSRPTEPDQRSASQNSDAPRNRVLRSATKQRPKKKPQELDDTSLPRFKGSSTSSSSSSLHYKRTARKTASVSHRKKNSSSRSVGSRGQYRKYTKEAKDRAIMIALRENSYIKAAEITKINPKNIKRWVTSGTSRRKGRHSITLEAEERRSTRRWRANFSSSSSSTKKHMASTRLPRPSKARRYCIATTKATSKHRKGGWRSSASATKSRCNIGIRHTAVKKRWRNNILSTTNEGTGIDPLQPRSSSSGVQAVSYRAELSFS